MGSKESGPSKYNEQTHKRIVSELRKGAFKKHAAELAGITHYTLDDWLTRGRAGEAPYDAFAREVDEAIAADAQKLQAVILRAAVQDAPGDWKAAAWLLERKHPLLYGQRGADAAYLNQRGVERVHSPWKQAAAPPPPAQPAQRAQRKGRFDA